MAELIVPEVNESTSDNSVTFYSVKSYGINQNYFSINDLNEHERNKERYKEKYDFESIFEKAHLFLNNQDIKASLSIRNFKNPREKLLKIPQSMQSVTLGILLELYREENHRIYRDRWDYIIVTGNYSEGKLEGVKAIKEKFEGIKFLAQKEPDKKIIFIYVDNEEPVSLGFDSENENLYVAAFKTDADFKDIFAEIFNPVFSQEQEMLLRRGKITNAAQFYETETYFALKSQIKNCKGFFISGQSNSGKTVLASALVSYAMESGLSYAPVWLTLNNVEIKNEFETGGSIFEYLKNQIKESVDFEIRADKKYILVLDNLEADYAEQILEALQDILAEIEWINFTIITSWNKVNKKELLDKLDFKEIPLQDFSKKDFGGVYQAIVRNFFSNNFERATEDEKLHLETLMYEWNKNQVGEIYSVLDALHKKTVAQLIKEVESNGQNPSERKSYFCNLSFSQLGLFSKIVLYEYIALFGCEDKICAKRDFPKILAKVSKDELISKDFISLKDVSESFSEIKSHALLEEIGSTKYQIKKDTLECLLFMKIEDESLIKIQKTCINDETRLETAIAFGWSRKFESLITKDNAVNFFFDELVRYSPNTDYLDMLMEKYSISINQKSAFGYSILQYAAFRNKNLKVFEHLISKGGDLKLHGENGESILHFAALNPDPEILDYLINEKGFSPKLTDSSGATLLHYAAQNPSLSVLEYVLENHFYDDINQKDEDGLTSLHYASLCNSNTKIYDLLVKNGANSHARGKNKETMLMLAAQSNTPAVVSHILKKNPKKILYEEDAEDRTPVLYAVQFNQSLEVTKLLIEEDSEHEYKWRTTKKRQSILHCAALNENHALLRFILQKHLFRDLWAEDKAGFDILAYTAAHHDLETLNLLVDYYGFDKNKLYKLKSITHPEKNLGYQRPDEYKLNLLHIAVMYENEEIVKELAEESANDSELYKVYSLRDKVTESFFSFITKFDKSASSKEFEHTMRSTFSRNINEKAKCYLPYDGGYISKTALDIAKETKNQKIIEILKKYGAKHAYSFMD